MIVFEYLFDMMDVFGPLMDEYAKGEVRHIDNEDKDKVRPILCGKGLSLLKTSVNTVS